ncbi:MAG: rhomboid family intramembrane serine protease [Planctomycetes bacterium]|nr:rhomboid family intramembrane serine protease [Planctomycetota bacterium]
MNRPGPEAEVGALRGWLQRVDAFPATFGVLCAVLVLYGFAASRAPLSTHVSTEALVRLGACRADEIPQQPWRLITAAFLHADLGHLACNAVGILLLLPRAEVVFGSARAWAIFLSCAVGGSLASELPRLLLGQAHSTVGASGGLCGLVGALYLAYRARGEHERARQLRDWGFLIAVISFVPGVNGLAHLGGVVLGAAWGATLRTPAHAAWTPCGILLGVTWLAAFAAVTLQ